MGVQDDTSDGTQDPKFILEKRKFVLEIAKFVISVTALGGIVVGVYQLSETRKSTALSARSAELATRNARIETYNKVVGRWSEHLKMVADVPEVRPYLTDGLPVPDDTSLRQKVFALADARLDAADAVLTILDMYGSRPEEIKGWINTVSNTFRTSPALCERYFADPESYGLIQRIGNRECKK